MHILLSSIHHLAALPDPAQAESADPIAFLSLDSSNAFNCLTRKQLSAVLLNGCAERLRSASASPAQADAQPQPHGWNLLWKFIASHYGCHGLLKLFHSGTVTDINSESGVQQGDPLGSTLFALAIHPVLLDLGRLFPSLLITAYADNVIFAGPLSVLRAAYDRYSEQMQAIGLRVNSSESAIFVPQWQADTDEHLQARPEVQQHLFHAAHAPVPCIPMQSGTAIPLARDGLPILGAPIGTSAYCTAQIRKTIASIQRDLDLLSTFDHRHQRTKLALYCCNSRIVYLLRALPLEVVRPELPHLDQLFETFIASTLCFEEGYSVSRHAASYDRALQQVRHGIKSGGFGLTPSTLLAPAASYVAFRDFHAWYFSLANHWKDSAAHTLSWLASKIGPPVPTHEPARIVFPYIQATFNAAKDALSRDWKQCGSLSDTRPQNTITSEMKALAFETFLSQCHPDEAARVAAVGLQTIPTRCSTSVLCPVRVPGNDNLAQCPMSLMDLMCPFELSDQAFITCMSLCLGVPVPHTRVLRQSTDYAHIDDWADFLLTDSAHASRSRHTSHNRLAFCLSNLAARAGLASSALQSDVPVAEEDTYRRGDIVTSVAGLSSSSTYRFSSQTQLITDVTITHPYTRMHEFKPNSLRDAEALKNRLYFSSYQTRGMAFAPLACNSFGQQAPEMLRYQWIVADRAAQRVVSLPDFSLPAAADLPGVVDEHASLLHLYQRRRQRFFRQSVQEVLVAIFEGVCERVFGRTFALQSYPEYLDFFRRCAVPWVPDFLHAPIAQGSPSGPPPEDDPASRSPGAVSPQSPPPSPGLGGASAIRTRSGRLSTAPRHFQRSAALRPGRGASRRRPTSVAASGSSPPAALARRAPTPRVPGGASARPPRSVGRGPRGRSSGPPAPGVSVSPSLSPAGGPGL